MSKNSKKFSYDESITEIQNILNGLETGKIGIDSLVTEIDKASDLIRQCKNKLHDVEGKVSEILDEDNESE